MQYTNITRKHPGEAIYQIRKQRGLSRRELSVMSGVHHNTILRVESMKVGILWDTIVDLFDSLGVSVIIGSVDETDKKRKVSDYV